MTKHNNRDTSGKNAIVRFFSERFTFGIEGNWRRTEIYIVGTYLILGVLWIIASDSMVNRLFSDAKTITDISIAKGWVYVLLTAVLLYLLIHSATRKMDSYRTDMKINYKKLTETVEKLESMNRDLGLSEEIMRYQRDKLLVGQKRISEKNRLHIALLDIMDDCVLELRSDDLLFSDRWLDLTGYPRDFLVQRENWVKIVHPDDLEVALAWMSNKDDNIPEARTGSFESRIKVASGEYKRLFAKHKSWYDEIDESWISIAVVKDMTAEKNKLT